MALEEEGFKEGLEEEDFIMAIQAAEEVQVRHGLPSLSRTTPAGSGFGAPTTALGSLLSFLAFITCGKRFDGISRTRSRKDHLQLMLPDDFAD